ncbi:MAG TPA: TetR/AcrR family transcriptional regulator [Stellaceae bacterium]|jgi:AcrR family transcriptional regulator|nr:TetR/AcrR family transcriptional regulator [Stellaceae bacterium]
MALAKFSEDDFIEAALAIASEQGPSAATVASVTGRLKAPIGSFYHRFASRDVLLGELWLRTVLEFQQGIGTALDAGDGLRAVLHTPAWTRANLDKARLLLLHHRDDFIQGDWPEALRDAVAAQSRQIETGMRRFARLVFGRERRAETRRAQFLLAELPLALVGQHLRRREPPPPDIDELIRVTYRAVVQDYRARHGQSRTGGPQ